MVQPIRTSTSLAAGNEGGNAATVTGNSLPGPEHGARVAVRLLEEGTGSEGAAYALTLATADATWDARATVTETEGRVDVGVWEPATAPPAWLVQAAHTVLRGAWQRRRAGNPWPRRLARWRPGPETAET